LKIILQQTRVEQHDYNRPYTGYRVEINERDMGGGTIKVIDL